MGDYHNYTSEDHKVSKTTDLAQSCEPFIQGCQSVLQQLTMAGILRGLQLLNDMFAGQQERLFLFLLRHLSGCKPCFRFSRSIGRYLLLLNRLAFPAASHV